MIDAIATEWLKIRTVRSTYYTLGVVALFVGFMAFLSWQVAAMWDSFSPEQRTHFSVSPLSDLTGSVAQMCLAVLGVLVITSEYASGMIRTTLTVLPGRRTVLAAKATVVAAVALVTGQVATVATFLLGRLIIGDRPIRGQPTGVADQMPLLLATGLSVMVFALVGLALAALTRSATAAIATMAALWYLLPLIVYHLPAPWNARIGSVVPGALPGQLAGTGNAHSVYGALLSPLGALAVMAAYALVPLGMAGAAMTRRDA
jgi:ABC-type transport system involved in multi-copper enzyme maturation permease subunit